MSRKDNLPRRAFSLRYLATHELDVSLKSATAFAMLGSVLSMFIVVLTFWITSCVSFAYSSSVAANAGDGVARSGVDKVVMAVSDKKLRRFEVVAAVVDGVVAEWLQRMSRRGFGVEVVGVIRVGDAMVQEKLKEVKARLNFEGCSGKNSKIQEVSKHFESRTPNIGGERQKGRRSGCSRSMSGSPKPTSVFSRIRRDKSESPRHRPVGKGRRDGGVFNRLGGKEKSVSTLGKPLPEFPPRKNGIRPQETSL
ncbi:hypothetical protein Tco_0979223 [Tanacetum coccineum]